MLDHFYSEFEDDLAQFSKIISLPLQQGIVQPFDQMGVLHITTKVLRLLHGHASIPEYRSWGRGIII